MIGCPLLSYLADRIGRRKPSADRWRGLMLLALAALVYRRTSLDQPYLLYFMLGMASEVRR